MFHYCLDEPVLIVVHKGKPSNLWGHSTETPHKVQTKTLKNALEHFVKEKNCPLFTKCSCS